MISDKYLTYLPRTVELDDGTQIILGEKEVLGGALRLYVDLPSLKDGLQSLVSHLMEKGFTERQFRIQKGEKYSLSKLIRWPWELHIRVFSEGFIDGEVEISSEYFEHHSESRTSVIDEVYEYYKDLYEALYIFSINDDLWLYNILDYYQVDLTPPSTLTPWKPIVIGIVTAAIGGAVYVLSRKTKQQGRF
jgi:hypothetical protein